ncbi:hypothetical protein PV08_12080 [Exophiala spinifera]|uniref:Uncharacterized protein n=1 Tax=Exophiala spinifera TaxID=91928 RepID=A0A0D2AT30_9EURO|nr:uncharacterized protein PV08_12080 [Exophiala spinifera]KIW09665.1 hypothetical protein PV08_12080 [Exophiala spinifera]
MSLLFDPDNKPRLVLTALWNAAHEKGAGEPEALSFWQHLLAKHEFQEDYFIIDAELRPEPGSRRRVDRGIRYMTTNHQLVVLTFIEAKGLASDGAKKEAERQALQDCKDYIRSHSWQDQIYALTILRTAAKAWIYNSEGFNPLHDDHYIEANSSEGKQLRKAFERMKSFPPAKIAGAPDLHVAARPTFPQPTTSSTSYANPIFPRNETSNAYRQTTTTAYGNPVSFGAPTPQAYGYSPHQATTSESVKPWEGFSHVVAKKNKTPGKNGILYKAQGVWVEANDCRSGEEDGKRVIYSKEKRIWAFVDEVNKYRDR